MTVVVDANILIAFGLADEALHRPANQIFALLTEAYELAVRFNRPRAYDSQYMALADRLQCDFWTADERLVNSVQAQFSRIHWLGNWTPPA